MFRWLGRNLSTLFWAFILALVVWVSAVLSTDPNEERVYPRSIPLEVIGQDQAYVQVNEIPTQVRLTLNAPQSIWSQLITNPDQVRAWIDLSGLAEGEHTLEVRTQVGLTPAQVVKVEPAEARVFLEPLVTETYQVQLNITGDPALGYRRETPTVDPTEVIISGPESQVGRVVEVVASLDVDGADETVKQNVSLQAMDENGDSIEEITILPSSVTVTQPVVLQGGFRNVVVKVETVGQVAEGYWLTNVTVSPPNVVVFSTNPQFVAALPGYVESNPIDLTGLSDDVDIRATLNLPDGVTLVGEESVLVRLSIAALEGSLPMPVSVDVIGLSPEYMATVSPEAVEVLLTGPLPILNSLSPASIRLTVDVTDLEPGVHLIEPLIDLLPNQVSIASITPENVEVIIEIAPTPTPTTGGANRAVPTQTPTMTPTLTSTITPTITVTPTP